eukprot:CAMPEP_0206212032 /NCGR_PEP_ID=MMETSP0047_2-20121206/330_1 /ASSEMBLY_ACC=CAM_ASM_000192 /TAXON_ID=195065 /ORGANISM="Chroomonas mesostigmatica_cf, Strain CCMP1168" /LENGTH=51 /DNA_ID=CAMNT_0053634003 /DNA_START=39 /DNA_END=194 /DNA_ORIENTATION=-
MKVMTMMGAAMACAWKYCFSAAKTAIGSTVSALARPNEPPRLHTQRGSISA